MEEILKEVLIKECGNGFHDKVFIVENLPKRLIFEKTRKMEVRMDKDGYTHGDMVPSRDKEMVDTLLPGIEASQIGDGGFLFWMNGGEGQARLAEIDNYIDRNLPRDSRIAARVEHTMQKGNKMASPLPLNQIPRVSLPDFKTPSEPVSPPAAQAVEQVQGVLISKEEHAELLELKAKKEAAKERMALARSKK